MGMTSISAIEPRAMRAPAAVLAGGVVIAGLSYGLVYQPWLFIGLVAGALVLATAIAAPLALVATILMVGSVDLSFMTGGFKALFPQLGGLDMNGIRLIGATAGFAVYILNAPAGRAAIVSRNALPYLFFLTYAFISLASSFNALEGLRLHLKLAYPLLTYLLVIGLCDTRQKLERLANLTLLGAALIIFVVTPLAVLKDGFHVDYAGFRRVHGVSGGASVLSFYLTIVLLFALSRFIFRKQLRYILLCAGAGFWIVSTATRIALLAALVGVLCIAVLAALGQKQYKAVAAGLLVALVVAVPGLPLVLERSLGFVPGPAELGALLTNPIALYELINWQGRTNFWPVVWAGFMTAPVFGLGLGSSGAVILRHFPADSAPMAHNEYLRLAADTGIVGITLFAVALFTWFGTALRASIKAGRDVAEYAVAAAGGLVAWALIAITDNPFDYYMAFTQYVGFLVGATVALRSIAAKEQHADHRLS